MPYDSIKIYYYGGKEEFEKITKDKKVQESVYFYTKDKSSDDVKYWHYNDKMEPEVS